jgi:glycosyltransferase involved in cell wall biosynthesis
MDDKNLPKISIVTPSYNQGQFIEETIQSILHQKYPNLEYMVIDGTSTDNSIDIIRKYEKYITNWISEPDDGSADAIQKGIQKCTGELFNWLNSDDYLLPGTLITLGKIVKQYPDFDIYAFMGLRSGLDGPIISNYHKWHEMNLFILSCKSCFAQESTFISLDFLREKNITIRKEFSNIYDTVIYEEMLANGARVLFINAFGGVIRHQPNAKTSIGVPLKDYVLKQELDKILFNNKLLFWRRLVSTRLFPPLRFLCEIHLVNILIKFLLGNEDVKLKNYDVINVSLRESWNMP